MVGGSASSRSMIERTMSTASHALNSASLASSTLRKNPPATPPRSAWASLSVTAVQPISTAWLTIGNWTVPASLIFNGDAISLAA